MLKWRQTEEKPAPPVKGESPFARPTTSKAMPKPPAMGRQLVTLTSTTPGHCEQTVRAAAHDLSHGCRGLEAIAADGHGHAHHVARGKPGLDGLQFEEGPDEQGRPDYEHEGERDLADHERSAKSST